MPSDINSFEAAKKRLAAGKRALKLASQMADTAKKTYDVAEMNRKAAQKEFEDASDAFLKEVERRSASYVNVKAKHESDDNTYCAETDDEEQTEKQTTSSSNYKTAICLQQQQHQIQRNEKKIRYDESGGYNRNVCDNE